MMHVREKEICWIQVNYDSWPSSYTEDTTPFFHGLIFDHLWLFQTQFLSESKHQNSDVSPGANGRPLNRSTWFQSCQGCGGRTKIDGDGVKLHDCHTDEDISDTAAVNTFIINNHNIIAYVTTTKIHIQHAHQASTAEHCPLSENKCPLSSEWAEKLQEVEVKQRQVSQTALVTSTHKLLTNCRSNWTIVVLDWMCQHTSADIYEVEINTSLNQTPVEPHKLFLTRRQLIIKYLHLPTDRRRWWLNQLILKQI